MKSREEDYLDNLLNSISGQSEEAGGEEKQKFSNLFHAPEEDFLKEFEAELNTDEESDFLREFEEELAAENAPDFTPYPEQEADTPPMNLDEIISGVKEHMDGSATEVPITEAQSVAEQKKEEPSLRDVFADSESPTEEIGRASCRERV